MVTCIKKIKIKKTDRCVRKRFTVTPCSQKNCLKITLLPIKFKFRMVLYDAKGNSQSINSFSKNNFQQNGFKLPICLENDFKALRIKPT